MRSDQSEKDSSQTLNNERKSGSSSDETDSSRESSSNSDSSIEEPAFIEDPKEQFTYENMIENFIKMKKSIFGHARGDFAAVRLPGSQFITFGYQQQECETEVGWKAHISINDEDKINLAKAWNTVKDIFIDEQLIVKVVVPNADLYKDKLQCGKQVTIYCHKTPDKNWEDIFRNIENALSDADIQPSLFSSSDKPIPGSTFLSYRNDDNGKGRYIASESNYNPGNHDDIFGNIELQSRGIRYR